MQNLFQFKDETNMVKINKMRSTLAKRAKENPDRRMAIFYAFAGHGIQSNGE